MLKMIEHYNLIPTTQKSYYNKAKVCKFYGKIGSNKTYSTIIALYSYDTLIACIDVTERNNKRLYLSDYYNYSATTRKHLHDFLKEVYTDMDSKGLKKHEKQQSNYLSKLLDNGLCMHSNFNDYICMYGY